MLTHLWMECTHNCGYTSNKMANVCEQSKFLFGQHQTMRPAILHAIFQLSINQCYTKLKSLVPVHIIRTADSSLFSSYAWLLDLAVIQIMVFYCFNSQITTYIFTHSFHLTLQLVKQRITWSFPVTLWCH